MSDGEGDAESAAAETLLRRIGAAPDAPFAIAEAALALAGLARRGLELAPYRHHLSAIACQVGQQAADSAGPAAGAPGADGAPQGSGEQSTLGDPLGEEGPRGDRSARSMPRWSTASATRATATTTTISTTPTSPG